MNIKVSIIIPFYNCKYVNKALYSAFTQSYSNVEIVLVNDGSTLYNERIIPFLNDSRLVYIEKQNGGTATALNAGIRASSGDYIAWLSSDDLFDREKIEKQLYFMVQNNYKISHTNYSWINSRGRVTNYRVGLSYPSKFLFYTELLKGCHINGCTVMFSKDVVDRIGLFDETLRYANDYEYWLRASQYYDFGYLDEPLTNYRVHHNMGSQKHRSEVDREGDKVIEKYTPVLTKLLEQNK